MALYSKGSLVNALVSTTTWPWQRAEELSAGTENQRKPIERRKRQIHMLCLFVVRTAQKKKKKEKKNRMCRAADQIGIFCNRIKGIFTWPENYDSLGFSLRCHQADKNQFHQNAALPDQLGDFSTT